MYTLMKRFQIFTFGGLNHYFLSFLRIEERQDAALLTQKSTDRE